MFKTEESIVYFRDQFIPFNKANLSIASAPVLYGLSIYTVFPVMANKNELNLFRLKDHFKRLQDSSRIVDFDNFMEAWDYDHFEKTMLTLLSRNKVNEDVLVRVMVYVDEVLSGTRMRNLNHNLTAFVYPYKDAFSCQGINLCVSSWRRTSDSAIPSRAKINGSYANSSLMKNEALHNGYDDAVALDDQGHVVESTVANIFMVRGDTLITPSGSSDLLEGITRDTILKIAKGLGIKTAERNIDRTELYIADEIFLCGSSVRIMPVFSVDRRSISDHEGPITKQISEEYSKAIYGNDPSYISWLHKLKI